MNFKPYPEYKNSNIEWIGSAPSGWSETPFFAHSPLQKVSNAGMVEDNLLSLSYGRIIRRNIETAEGLLPASFETYQIVESDDIVFRLTDLQNDKRSLRSAKCEERGIITSAYLAVRPKNIDASYFAYLMRAYDLSKVFYALGSGLRQSLKYSDMKWLPLLVPSSEEQKQIAAFLDYETAKIDKLIEKQQQLIALLGEKRQAVISHAVTKGLNPDAPMRESGIEWLGEVPEHWIMRRLKHISPSVTVGIVVNPSTFATEEGLPFIHGGDIRVGVINAAEARRISPQSSDQNAKTKLTEGDVLTVRVGAGSGTTAVVPPECTGGNCASVMLVRKGKFNSDWLCFAMNDQVIQFQREIISYGAAQPQFNISHAIEFWFPVPPRHEQDEIAQRLLNRSGEFDGIVGKAENAVELLQERRTALISAAVTGKIDVRNWKRPSSDRHLNTKSEVA